MNSEENIRARSDDAPGTTRQLVIDDVTFAESVLMYEALDLMRSAYARGLSFALGIVDESKSIVTINEREYVPRTEVDYAGYLAAYAEMRGGYRCATELVSPLCAAIAADDARRGDSPRTAEDLRAKVLAMSGSVVSNAIRETALVRDEVGLPVVPATKLSDLLNSAPQNLGCVIDVGLDARGVFDRINEFLALQFMMLQCNRQADKQAQIVGVSRDVWAKLQEYYPCTDESMRVTSAEMVMRANPQLTKLHVVDFDLETSCERSNCVAYRIAVSDATA